MKSRFVFNNSRHLSRLELEDTLGILFDYVDNCLDHIFEFEWDIVESDLQENETKQPCDTVVWNALMVNHYLHGAPHPSVRFMEHFKGLEVDEEGIITNREEYYG